MDSVLVTGGTGLIGKQLCKLLKATGYKVTILSRYKSNNPNTYYWNINDKYIDPDALTKTDYIIHLAGANIAEKRWTRKRKLELMDSRIKSANLLFEKVKVLNPTLKGFIAASGVGYYGAITSHKIYIENDPVGNDFLSTICKLWEKATNQFNLLNIRTVLFRTGVVLSKDGGAFDKLSRPIKLGFGAALGNGQQFMPWIHIDDLCQMYLNAIENTELSGIYNAVAPEHITNKILTHKLSSALYKKIWLPNIPTFVLKLIVGKMAIILLEGSRVSSEKIEKTNFNFNYKTLDSTLKNLLKKS